MGFLDYRKQEVKDLGIHPRDCSFNPGVFVADISEWKKQKITKQLEKWMEENFRYLHWPSIYLSMSTLIKKTFFISTRHNIYSSAVAGGVVTPPMLIVFYEKYTTLDPLWNVRHLGMISTSAHICKDHNVTFLRCTVISKVTANSWSLKIPFCCLKKKIQTNIPSFCHIIKI